MIKETVSAYMHQFTSGSEYTTATFHLCTPKWLVQQKLKKSGFIYLAQPFTGNFIEQEHRIAEAKIATVKLIDAGFCVYSPICHANAFATHFSGWEHQDWMRQCIPLVRAADSVFVLMLDGWDKSEGVRLEVAEAFKLKKPLVFLSI